MGESITRMIHARFCYCDVGDWHPSDRRLSTRVAGRHFRRRLSQSTDLWAPVSRGVLEVSSRTAMNNVGFRPPSHRQ